MTDEHFIVQGAREHNLKGVSVRVPKNKLVVFTGVSGSGKSSLLFDTIYAEAHRQLLQTWSAFSRTRLPSMDQPKFEAIKGICPAIVIDQKRLGQSSRSTVGTATEIYNLVRVLFANFGKPNLGDPNRFSFNKPQGMCSHCKGIGQEVEIDEVALLDMDRSLAGGAILHHDYKVGGWFWRSIRNSRMFDMQTPLRDFTETEIQALLYFQKEDGFEGIAAGIKRRRLQRDSTRAALTDTKYFEFVTCSVCHGHRLNPEALAVTVGGKTIAEIVDMELLELASFIYNLKLEENDLSTSILKTLRDRIDMLNEIGVGYLTLGRPVGTLSGGESQRVKMARQLGCDLVGLMYVFDEPSVGLHHRDIRKLCDVLKRLRDMGNSILVVEHEPIVILSADYLIDLGPYAGSNGGQLLFQGPPSELKNTIVPGAQPSPTALHLVLRPKLQIATRRRPNGHIRIENARVRNLKGITVDIPTGVLVCVTGVAGSGKSTLVHQVFVKENTEAIVVDQSPVGRSSRSNPATYSGSMDFIRKEFAGATGQKAGLFSFNSEGACSSCNGLGRISVEMHFLESVYVECSECHGRRFKEDVLEMRCRGKNIADVLELTIDEALLFFERSKQLQKRLKMLGDVGLGYLKLGQSVSTLSGGEAQRLKLASELHKSGCIYVMDEPTLGLHLADIQRLVGIIHRLVNAGNTVLVIEHNLDIVAHADWVIDLGPEGGSRGGQVVAVGTPEEVSKNPSSITGKYIGETLENVEMVQRDDAQAKEPLQEVDDFSTETEDSLEDDMLEDGPSDGEFEPKPKTKPKVEPKSKLKRKLKSEPKPEPPPKAKPTKKPRTLKKRP